MLKAFKYRIYPTQEQSVLLNKHIGSVRFLYNLALETKQIAYASRQVNLSRYELQVQLKDLKNDCEWLKEINSQSLQVALMNLDAAYLRFFKGQSEFPVFKKKSNGGSFNVPQSAKISGNKLLIPKFKGGIKIVLHRPIKGEIRQATLSKTPTGKYFASILCDTGQENKIKANIKGDSSVGIDLGVKTFIVSSDGKQYGNPKFLRKAENKLKYIQRKYSKYKGKRTKKRVGLLHEKVANQRKDFLHKVSSELIKNHDTICIETLQVSNMIKNHKLALSISDAGWASFVTMLEYKARWYGNNVLKIGTFEPSSKMCSSCGQINKELALKDRLWNCCCGAKHDRDTNAAINIKNFALNSYLSVGRGLKNQNELPTLVGVLTSESIGL